MDRNKGVKYAAAAYSVQVLRGGGLETLARERDSSPLEIERNRDPRVREGYLSILEGPLQDWSELFSRGGQGGREGGKNLRVWKGDDDDDGGATGRTGSLLEMEDGGGWVVVERRETERELLLSLEKSRESNERSHRCFPREYI